MYMSKTALDSTNDTFCCDPDCPAAPSEPDMTTAVEAYDDGAEPCDECWPDMVAIRAQSSGDTPFHTDIDCRYCPHDEPNRKTAVMLAWGFRVCKECAPEVLQ